MNINVRAARVADARAILNLVNRLAMDQIMLPRSPASVIESIRDFVVAEADGRFVGCGALHVTWSDIGEIRSVAVDTDLQQKGAGRVIVERLVEDARALGIPKLFVFTYVPGFFQRVGFEIVDHESLPQKVFSDCMHCPKFQACDEIAMERVLDPDADTETLFGLPRRAGGIPVPRARKGGARSRQGDR